MTRALQPTLFQNQGGVAQALWAEGGGARTEIFVSYIGCRKIKSVGDTKILLFFSHSTGLLVHNAQTSPEKGGDGELVSNIILLMWQ